MAKAGSTEKVVREIRWHTRRRFSAEEKGSPAGVQALSTLNEGRSVNPGDTTTAHFAGPRRRQHQELERPLGGDRGLGGSHGVVARIVTGPHDAHRQDPHWPMRYDTGRPSSVIRLRISQPRTTSLPCPAGLRARRPSPMMDV